MASAEFERRVAPRFALRCAAELAAGAGRAEVTVSDVSVTGCAIEVAGPLAALPGETGVLSLRPADAAPLTLPVVVSRDAREGGAARIGLRFGALTVAQIRGLIGVIDAAIDR